MARNPRRFTRRWELTLDPNKKRWDNRSGPPPVIPPPEPPAGPEFLLDEDGFILLDEPGSGAGLEQE